MSLQNLILNLQTYWAGRGCYLAPTYDLEVGAGTMTPDTFFRVLGPKPWKVAYVQDVQLGPDDIERLATWMDANALFYGTFDPAGQARQQRGERIDGPALE